MSHVIIVGAGVSGMIAAKRLIENGHSITIVEARDRTGGRIHTFVDNFSHAVEGGAEFVHGKQPITLSLLESANIETKLFKGQYYTISKNELEHDDSLGDNWNLFYARLKTLDNDATLSDFLAKNFSDDSFGDFKEYVIGFAEGFDIADPDRASVRSLGQEWAKHDDELQYRVLGGYQRLVEYLDQKIREAGGEIVLSTEATDVRWNANSVTVVAADGREFNADKVIITLPAGVIQSGSIKFSPSIEAAEYAYSKIGFGGVVKFLFEFKTYFWADCRNNKLNDGLFFLSDASVPTWWTQLPDKLPLLTGWLGGPKSFQASHDINVLYQRAIESLAYIFQLPLQKIESELVAWRIIDWSKDPFARGGYTYPTIDGKGARELLNKGIADTIYFSGEALYSGDAVGTVEAALASGLEVAGRLGNVS